MRSQISFGNGFAEDDVFFPTESQILGEPIYYKIYINIYIYRKMFFHFLVVPYANPSSL